ncbi:hypothetical protein BGZ58_009573 [Dissophora ornata]|nr:hypothetical protein BGZ58_009573 [Dissophora ornata]
MDHEGVMIQCETCKVWQHCPCVGLGDGEVTPDKYYCDSCRPENHPYKVVNGQLISNSKSSTISKSTKKRSTMNSKEASLPMEMMLAQQKWFEEHQDVFDDDFTPRVSSKRRKKTESNNTDLEDNITHQDTRMSKESVSALPSRSATSPLTSSKEKAGVAGSEQDTAMVTASSSSLSQKIHSKDNNEDPSLTPNSSSQSNSHQQVPVLAAVYPAAFTKKSCSKRGSDRVQSVRNGSRHSTPTPATEETPQPIAPIAPATVRYPSSKMTIQEMTKRAKQLLDYISRVQIDMADRKSKSGSLSPQDESTSTPKLKESSPKSHYHHLSPLQCHQRNVEVKETSLFQLPAAVSATTIYGDSQVCPDLSRSSMDSTVSSMDGLQEPSSPLDTKVPIKESVATKEMTIKVLPMDGRNTLPLLSTPPLSIHDHHHHHHSRHERHERHGSGTPESEATHEPLTPPHQPTEATEQQQLRQQKDSESLVSSARFAITERDVEMAQPGVITSMELMDKLTGDLIRFQEKFGAHS